MHSLEKTDAQEVRKKKNIILKTNNIDKFYYYISHITVKILSNVHSLYVLFTFFINTMYSSEKH